MRATKLSKDRQQRFLAALAGSGNLIAAAQAAGLSEEQVYELHRDAGFSAEWEAARQKWVNKLEEIARQRAVEGVIVPVISDGKVVRDDDGQAIAKRCYSDELLLALLKSERPEKFHDYRMVEIAIYPRWLRYLIAAFVVIFAIWVIGDLILPFIQDRFTVLTLPRQ